MEQLKVGNTTIYIVPPKVTEEIKKERLDETIKLIYKLYLNKIIADQ